MTGNYESSQIYVRIHGYPTLRTGFSADKMAQPPIVGMFVENNKKW